MESTSEAGPSAERVPHRDASVIEPTESPRTRASLIVRSREPVLTSEGTPGRRRAMKCGATIETPAPAVEIVTIDKRPAMGNVCVVVIDDPAVTPIVIPVVPSPAVTAKETQPEP